MNEKSLESKRKSKLSSKTTNEKRGGFYCISFRKDSDKIETRKENSQKNVAPPALNDTSEDFEDDATPVLSYETKALRPRRKRGRKKKRHDGEVYHSNRNSYSNTPRPSTAIRLFSKEESRQQLIEINNHEFDLIHDFGMNRDRQKKSVCCPCCGNGNGNNGDGLSFLKRNSRFQVDKFHCFRCCKSFSRIDLYMLTKGGDPSNKQQFHEAVEELKKIANHEFTGATIIRPATTMATVDEDKDFEQTETQKEKAIKYLKDLSPFDTTPIKARRGVSVETANRFNVFYHSRSQRIVFKYSSTQYKSRSIIKNEKVRYINNGGAQRYFGDSSIINGGAKILFFVEGTFDAISGFETGVEGVDFVSYEGAQIDTFCKYLKRHNFHNSGRDVVFFGDDDDGGRRFRETFKQFAIENRINTHFLNIPIRYTFDPETGEKRRVKDFNDYLLFDRNEFTQFIRRTKEAVESKHVATNTNSIILEELRVVEGETPQLETVAIEEMANVENC